ncbi:sterol desaturase family protein [Chryseobacterium shigense]|uniref:Sterol desaturase/sphingolipid hydroxylase (Fatty acid hydroxylase superfamily) n=1 Tax=Chryseobacterium shigense TaxID=297244 RepID=A0A841N360_9FLAO|nr:sterol desaturase family protein [Chryseobacterium shigense]MBB6371586.1 sterol desaturase/sphingolipid hydroxylase (fatty acid hydroxylase superfamily) [Chryseobacterium shigense]
MKHLKDFFDLGSTNLLYYFFFAGLCYWLCYIMFKRTLYNAKIQQKEIKKEDVIREIFHSVISTFVMALLILLVTHSFLNQYTKLYRDINDYSLYWLVGSTFVGLFIHDTYFYWMHRILHHKKIFKYVHLIHHKSTNPSPFAAYSFHMAEAIAEGLIVPILLFIIPLHFISIYIFIVSSLMINIYGHLGYEIAPKWLRNSFLFTIFNTSVYHNLHHNKFKGNYGLYFRFWDKIMKTENPDYVKTYDRIQEKRFGKQG